MRFTAPCVREGCAQWTGSSCGVIERVLATGAHEAQPARLPRCASAAAAAGTARRAARRAAPARSC